MGIRAEIYKSANFADCSNGGVSSFFDTVTIVNIDGPFEPTDDAPPVLLQTASRRGRSMRPTTEEAGAVSDIQGGKAISLVNRGGITQDKTARVYRAEGSGGNLYTVVLGRDGAECSCPAGQHGTPCYHVRAARLAEGST
ncbi:MAG: SWIM zinc finger domain-containing protein [Chloroflexi bacterium]|nr:SWIM zinc finger domain-containing protein [Chloroflexota bacterium]